jgi:hypothetical protein
MLSPVYTMIVVMEEQLTAHDVDRVATLHGDEPLHVHLVQPVDTEHNRLVEALDEILLGRLREAARANGEETPSDATLAARAALDGSLQALQDAGVAMVDGELAGDDPVPAAVEAARRLDADEILVITPPHLVEEALNRDWASQLRDRCRLPVLHVVAGTDRVVG